jgi:hypothetical protein
MDWAAATVVGLNWLQWLIATVATSAVVGLAVRHFTKTAITHAFQVQLEKLKFEHAQTIQKLSDQSKLELERTKAELNAEGKKELEYIKAEIALFASNATTLADRQKSLYMQVANVRATSYPKLVSLLRRMKRQFEGLQCATVADLGGPINLDRKSKRSEMARSAIKELAQLEKEFDDELSSVRLFTSRSNYYLQSKVKQFCNEWTNKTGNLSVSAEFLIGVIEAYNDDISYLSEEFYKPTIDIGHTGELLPYSNFLDPDDVIEARHKSSQEKVSREVRFTRWLVSRKPGENFDRDGENSPTSK